MLIKKKAIAKTISKVCKMLGWISFSIVCAGFQIHVHMMILFLILREHLVGFVSFEAPCILPTVVSFLRGFRPTRNAFSSAAHSKIFSSETYSES